MTKHKQPVSPAQTVSGKVFGGMIAREKQRISQSGVCDAPFATLTWNEWHDTREQVEQCLSRFRCAVEEKRSDQALMVSMEMLEMTARLFLEAYAQVADQYLNLEPVPLESILSCM
jgi:hypothetical protein